MLIYAFVIRDSSNPRVQLHACLRAPVDFMEILSPTHVLPVIPRVHYARVGPTINARHARAQTIYMVLRAVQILAPIPSTETSALIPVNPVRHLAKRVQ